MKTAAQAGNLLQEPAAYSGDNSMTQMTEVAKAFGINMPEMAKEQNRLMQQLAEAKQEASNAQGRADVGRLEAQIDSIKNMNQANQQNDPFRDIAVEMAKSAMQRTQGSGDEDPVANAYKQFIMNKTLNDLEMSQSPPSVSDQVGSAVETLKAIKEMATAFSPPPPPPPAAGLTPEKNMELELKKLEIEQQLEMYRIQKQTEAEQRKAQGMQDAIKMIGGAIEGIGKNIADQLVGNGGGYAASDPGPMPSSVNHIDDSGMMNPSEVEEDANALVGKLVCPDCGEEGVYITKQMYDIGQTGQVVPAACVLCGARHELGDTAEQEEERSGPIPPPVHAPPESNPNLGSKGVHSSLEPARVGRNGKERPPRRSFTSVD